ncbi:hypothetical protein PsorP6_009938 [Peronosclerospora sorghi]|uniref:Uncharacterized protein n=1 Tax=Peronosclerospora sorghi TaxID=230839 RepID=A0ACC0VVY0_9STRA|nr:hypothetical protein PsorP6_009938 [Peronosclerospora sorghi]
MESVESVWVVIAEDKSSLILRRVLIPKAHHFNLNHLEVLKIQNPEGSAQARGGTAVDEETPSIVRKLSFSGVTTGRSSDPEQEPPEQHEKQALAEQMTNQVQLVICVRPLERALTGKPEYFRVLSEVTLLSQPPKTFHASCSTGTAISLSFPRVFRLGDATDRALRCHDKARHRCRV